MNEMMNDPTAQHDLQTHYQNCYGLPPEPRNYLEASGSLSRFPKAKRPWWTGLLDIPRRLHRPRIAQPTVPSRRRYANPGVLVVGVIACLLLMVATTAYAFSMPVLDGLLKDLGMQQLQYSDFHQTKSIDGFTLSLDKVYADANLVVVGYTVTVPTGQNTMGPFDMGKAKLSTEQGLVLPDFSNAGVGLNSWNLRECAVL